jgi:hypothetical protein
MRFDAINQTFWNSKQQKAYGINKYSQFKIRHSQSTQKLTASLQRMRRSQFPIPNARQKFF